jgi:RNA polymerase sigma-70 factor (ECF subfamily)
MSTGDVRFLDNEQLLVRYQRADAAAFEEFFRRHANLVFNYLYHRLGNRQDAEEAVQRTFLKIHRYILSYDPNQKAIAWLLTIARNVAIDVRSERKLTNYSTDVESNRQTVEATSMLESRDALRRIVAELSPSERTLLEKHFLGPNNLDEIAVEEKVSAASLRQKLSRLLRRLQKKPY